MRIRLILLFSRSNPKQASQNKREAQRELDTISQQRQLIAEKASKIQQWLRINTLQAKQLALEEAQRSVSKKQALLQRMQDQVRCDELCIDNDGTLPPK